MHEDVMEVRDPLPSVRAPAQQKLKTTERVAACNSVTCISLLALMSVRRNVASGERIIAMSASFVQMYPRYYPQRE